MLLLILIISRKGGGLKLLQPPLDLVFPVEMHRYLLSLPTS